MSIFNREKILAVIDELLHRATYGNIFSKLLHRALLGVLGASLLFLVAAPALVAFALAGRMPAYSEVWTNIGIGWLLLLLLGIAVAIVVLIAIRIKKVFDKREP